MTTLTYPHTNSATQRFKKIDENIFFVQKRKLSRNFQKNATSNTDEKEIHRRPKMKIFLPAGLIFFVFSVSDDFEVDPDVKLTIVF